MNEYIKEKLVKETRELSNHSRTMSNIDNVEIQGREFNIHPKVFHPGIFFSSNWFAGEVSKLVLGENSFCEVGCGSGVVVCTALINNPQLEATAIDINECAVENTKENSKRYSLENRLACMHSDVLDNVRPSNQFDSIFWAMPFGYLDPEEEIDIIDMQTFDPGYRAIEKFFRTAKDYLSENGRLLIGFSEEIGTRELLNKLADKYGFSLELIKKEEGLEKSPVTMEILEARLI